MQNEKLKKFTDFFVKYRRYFCAAVLFVILVVILESVPVLRKIRKRHKTVHRE